VISPSTDGTARCLIVDDDAQVRQVLARVVATHGLSPIEAGTGAEALAALERGG
jgi:CheY-like chemotaxis protein